MAQRASKQGKKSHAQIQREVDDILAGEHKEPSSSSSLPGTQRFRVDVENQPRRIVNSAKDALRHGTLHVYLRSSEIPKFREHLERGQPVAWTYGFTSVEIAPHDEEGGPSQPSLATQHHATRSRRKQALTSRQREVRAEDIKAEARALQALGDSAPRSRVLAVDRKLRGVLDGIDPFWVRWSAFIDGEGGGRVGPSWREP